MFEPTYKLAEKKIPPLPWEEYERLSAQEYQRLLAKEAENEAAFQEFFQRNPSYLPGGWDLDDGSGHGPYPAGLIAKPNLLGSFERQPDFLWLASYSGVFHPILVEIERPTKLVFTKGEKYRVCPVFS